MSNGGNWNWDKVSDKFWSEPAEDVYFLLHRWRKTSRLTVLDLGCGLGRHSLLFAADRFRVTAMDSSESGLRRLQNSARERQLTIDAVRADVTRLPFEEKSFDAVLAYHSIYHVDSEGMTAAMAELHRIIKPNGEVFLTLNSKSNPTYSDPNNQVLDDNVRMKLEEDGSILPHFYCDLGNVIQLLSRFSIITLRQIEDIYDGKSSWHYFVHASL